jgi:dihydropyrimidinase
MLHHNVDCKKRSLNSVVPKLTFQDTPYEGKEFVNWPRYTVLRGKVIWAEGELKGEPYNGEYLKRGPSYFGAGPSGRRRDTKKTATWLR